jgi:ankyrin repeat protein
VLLAAGADPNVRNSNGQTALMLILQEKYGIFYYLIAPLLAAGADAKLRDNENLSALEYADEDDQELILLLSPVPYEN